ncbi:uncharacterized protein LOC111696737 [Eurytemora carolleeae]|uniref:uncharacterized protein LOC111696737 n=1 Tax=Eurytemora carolleeae TaxID=1294199 RepID=UPI000C769EB7|nr:uncharacterized protein LOC111696737 [Eurytemora carolleeae]|eukprot:XP_023322223.1 uncharacterized protein LOC111696737 [Eurytemora affinis]
MALSVLFAVRGFLAFVAFIEFVNALRSLTSSLFVDAEDRLDVSFVQNKIFVGSELSLAAESIISQLFGFYSLLNSCVLLVSAVFTHYKPVVYLGILALGFKAVFYIIQGFLLRTIPLTAGLQVPLLITILALSGLLFLSCILQEGSRTPVMGSENEDLLRQMRFPKSRKSKNL